MKKRILSFLLAGVLLLAQAPSESLAQASAESLAQAPSEASAAVTPDEAAWPDEAYAGGVQVEAFEISDKAGERLGIVDESDLSAGGELRQYSGVYGSQVYNTAWDVYSSNYIYNRLGTRERKLWDLMDAECRKYLTTSQDAKQQQVKNQYGQTSTCYAAEGIDFLSQGLTQQKAGHVYLMFAYANPQYYFLNSSYLYTSRALYPVMYDAFGRGAARKSETNKMKSKIDDMKSKIEKGATDLEKARIAHDLIIRKVNYDHDYATSKPNTLYHQSAYSVFCDSYTVCAGYTKAFGLLMNSVGIDALGVTSFRSTGLDGSGEGHAWNAVCLNDSWYYVDCTWDDLDGDGLARPELQYAWFGVSEATLTGEMDKNQFHKAEAMYFGLLPKCTRDLGSTQDKVGMAYVPTQATEAPRVVGKKTSDGVKITLKTTTPGAEIYYTTDGGTPSTSFSRSYYYTGSFTVSSNVTLKAVAVCDGKIDSGITSVAVKGKLCKVTFDTMGGGKVSAQKVWPGEVAAKPASPKRKGFMFAGWYSDKSCTTAWKFSNKIMKNTTVYAKWSKVKVKETAVTRLKKLSGGKLEVTLSKVGDAKGYQIRYSTKSSMKSSKKALSPSNKKTVSGLKDGVTYYVQARAYKLDSAKKKVYGKWSNIKTVTVR